MGPPPFDQPARVSPRHELETELWQFHTFNLVVLGILIFLLVYNTILFLTTRFKRYRFYLLGMITVLVEILRESGLLVAWLAEWATFPVHQHSVGIVNNTLQLLFAPLVVRDLLQIPQRYPKIDWLFRFHPFVCFGGMVLSFLDFAQAQTIVEGYVLGMLLLFAVLIILNLIRGYRHSKLIFLGVGAFIFFGLINWSGAFGLIYIQDVYLSSFRSIGTIILDTCMSFVLARMVWDLRQENLTQQQRLIDQLEREKHTQQWATREVAKARERMRRLFAERLNREIEGPLVSLRDQLSTSTPRNNPEDHWEELLNYTSESIRKAREISHEMMPSDLRGGDGLYHAVEEYLDRLREQHLRIHYSTSGQPDLPLAVRALGYRVVRELVTQAIKESAADEIRVNLDFQKSLFSITVEDDGNQPPTASELEVIRLNVSLFKGKVTSAPRAKKGTRVQVLIPTDGFLNPEVPSPSFSPKES